MADITEDKLHRGILLGQNKKKFWIDNEAGRNCFLLFARDLRIVWGDDKRYWKWVHRKDSSEPEVEVAELLNVCWLEVTGAKMTSTLSPGITYKFVLRVKLTEKAYGWETPVNLKLKTPDDKTQESQVSLKNKPKNQWFDLELGEFFKPYESESKRVNELIEFSIMEIKGGAWKSGLIIDAVVVMPIGKKQ